MADLEWTGELVIRLVQEYQARPELWDAQHESYRVQTLKYEAWRDLAAIFDCDIPDLRKKMNSLFASHRREKAKIRGGGGRSNWFLYRHLRFLPSHVADDQNVENDNESAQPMKTNQVTVYCDEDKSEQYIEEDIEPVETEVFVKEEPVVVRKPKVQPKPHFKRPIKRRPLAREYANVKTIQLPEGIKVVRRSETRKKDECDSFGEYIADSLRKHDDRTQSMIKQAINNILFEQEMKKYGTQNQYTVVISGTDENPLILDGKEKFKC